MKNKIKKSVLLFVFLLSYGMIFLSCDNPFWPDRKSVDEQSIDERNFDKGSDRGGNVGVKIPGINPDPVIQGNFYTVKFEADGGIPAPGNQNIAEGAKVIKPSPMSNGSFGFAGWYKDNGFSNLWDFSIDTVSGETTLYAAWAMPGILGSVHTVQFDPDGGRPEPSEQRIVNDSFLVEPSAMNKNGYGFGGWFIDPGLTVQWDFTSDTVQGDITLHAKWDTQYDTVSFEANGGLPEPRNQDLAYGTTAVEPQAMNRDGYGFGGWYGDSGFSSPWDFDTDTVTANITLYAKWVVNTCRVMINPSDGRAPAMLTVPYGSKLPEMPVMLNSVRSFLGWFLAPAFTYKWDFDNDVVTSDMELHAMWGSVDYVVTFMSERIGGYVIQEQGIVPGGKATEHPPIYHPTARNDWGFAGWYTDTGVLWDFDTVVTQDFILYPKWIPTIPGFVWVPKGSFMMGDDKISGALPSHKVTLTEGFHMGKYPVTQAEFADVGLGTPSHFNSGGSTLPVECVSWYMAIDYCNKLSDIQTLDRVYTVSGSSVTPDWTKLGYRLPTEAEWEYAARGGNGSPGNYTYSGSNDPDAVAWYNGTANGITHPVGTKAPNGLGFYDMSGNVCEWCWDWFDANYYNYSDPKDPKGPPTGTNRVRRGGCWSNTNANVRSVIRNSFVPTNNTYVMGFRVVRSPDLSLLSW